MKPGGGKAKGSAFEREVCKTLSRWITNGAKDDCFWRSAMSGGRATVAHKAGKDVRQAGDITAVASEGHTLCDHFFIECKHVADLDVDSFLIEDIGRLSKFWKQAITQAARHQRIPMLIARENRRGVLLVSSGPLWNISRCPPLLVRRDGASIYDFDALMATPFLGNDVQRTGIPRLKSIRG
jgi:hypothetical protein